MELVYYTPNKLYSYPKIARLDPTQVSFAQMFNPSISIIDRTETIKCPPVPIRNEYSLVGKIWEPQIATFEELCIERFDKIMKYAIDSNKTLVLFYSGGIDSTLIVVLAMMHKDFLNYRSRIKLVFSEDSIRENPIFWEKYIIPYFQTNIENASGFQSLISNPVNLCVTGEFADNIFGSLTLKSYIDVSNDNKAIHKSFNETGKKWLLEKITNPSNRKKCDEMLQQILNTSNRKLETNHDCFWWLNFILKWQAVNYRLVSHSPTVNDINSMMKNIIHFFNTDEFQNWAVMTDEPKVKDDWFSYKLPAKKMIFNFNHDEYYFKWKTKYPSIPSLTRYANMFDFVYFDSKINNYSVSKVLYD